MSIFVVELGFFVLSFPAMYVVARREPGLVRKLALVGISAVAGIQAFLFVSGALLNAGRAGLYSMHKAAAHWSVVVFWVVLPVALGFALAFFWRGRSWHRFRQT